MDTIPKTTKDLYLEMYCKVKGSKFEIASENLKIEALKSWIGLSKEDKQHFQEKLLECHRNYKQLFADYLENSAELYMKEQTSKQTESKGDAISRQEEQEIRSNNDFEENSLLETRSEEPPEMDNEDHSNGNMTPPNYAPEPEPTPPTALNARRLYELTCKTNPNWYALSTREKKRYQNALSTLKRQYINNYKSFLESLSDKDLYEHYVKTMY